MTQTGAVLDHIDANLDGALERILELLRIESISTDPAFAPQCKQAGQWLVDDLATIGFEAKLVETIGHPMVLAHYRGAPDRPHVLFYGHYDVQPVDPLDLWNHPPFEPRVEPGEDGEQQIKGRGSSDDKGQLMTFVEAARAWKSETGDLPINVTILFEGEEESGSPSLKPFIDEYKDELKADLALVCDTGMWDADTPAITTALRGLLGEEIIIKAADRDLHSGAYGSAAANPIRILANILADLHDDNGAVTVPGFYDGVPELTEEVRAEWQALGLSDEAFLGEIGLAVPAGEKGYSALEQTWARPTGEFNGIVGGYTGDGFKTVIAAQASAKVSFRLVGTQDPHTIRKSFRAFVRERIPADCSVEFLEHGAGPALVLDPNLPQLRKAVTALQDEWQAKPALIGSGGSIPIVGDFKRSLGMDSLLIGFALSDDRIHSPNEKYNLKSFHKGIRSWARIIAALAE